MVPAHISPEHTLSCQTVFHPTVTTSFHAHMALLLRTTHHNNSKKSFRKNTKQKNPTINIGKIFAACKASDSFPLKYQRRFYPQKSSKLLMLFSLLGTLDWILLTVCILYIFWAKLTLKGKIILDIILRRPMGGVCVCV